MTLAAGLPFPESADIETSSEDYARRFAGRVGESRLDAAVARVAERSLDPYAAVEELLRG